MNELTTADIEEIEIEIARLLEEKGVIFCDAEEVRCCLADLDRLCEKLDVRQPFENLRAVKEMEELHAELEQDIGNLKSGILELIELELKEVE